MRPSTQGFSRRLISWYRVNARDLPWRQTRDPYKIWVSEIMLQQTTVNAVIPYYQRWITTFPTIRHVAKSRLQKILKAWQGLGYYQRAKNLHKAAQIICREHDAYIPADPNVLRKLPGFGPYTTGAVLSIAFDQRRPIIDANVRRVVMRQLAIKAKADAAQDAEILKFLDRVMPQKANNIFNQALMELGALVCRQRQPVCNACPVYVMCQAYGSGIQELIPSPRKIQIVDVQAVVGIIKHGGNYFIQKRSSRGLLADLWEFPGGKVESHEKPQDALYREISEETGCEVKSARPVITVMHCYTQFRVRLHAWICLLHRYPGGDRTHRWVRRSELRKYPMPSGSAKIVDFLISQRI